MALAGEKDYHLDGCGFEELQDRALATRLEGFARNYDCLEKKGVFDMQVRQEGDEVDVLVSFNPRLDGAVAADMKNKFDRAVGREYTLAKGEIGSAGGVVVLRKV